MKQTCLLLLVKIFLVTSSFGQEISPGYDSTLANNLGADEYGMKKYIFVILKTGPVNVEDTAWRNQLFRGHFENINNLSSQGKLIVAGPLEKNDRSYRGIFILNAKDIEEAQNMLQKDPVIREGLMDAELYWWYGSAALSTYLDVHKRIQKTTIQ